MTSIDLIRDNLRKSGERVLLRVEDMRDHAFVFPTPRGGAHTVWVLGHLTVIEGLVTRSFMLGEPNPWAEWTELFDSDDTSGDPDRYPPFDDVLTTCRRARAETIALVDGFSESDLDRVSANAPDGVEDTFGSYRLCLQFVSDHWYMHRGQLACARRAAAIDRMWY